MGFSIVTHYCGDTRVASALVIVQGDLDCGMSKVEQSSQPISSHHSISKKKCCQNNHLSLNVEDDFQQVWTLHDVNMQFVFAFVQTYINIILYSKVKENLYANYSSPPLRLDRHILFQSFLI